MAEPLCASYAPQVPAYTPGYRTWHKARYGRAVLPLDAVHPEISDGNVWRYETPYGRTSPAICAELVALLDRLRHAKGDLSYTEVTIYADRDKDGSPAAATSIVITMGWEGLDEESEYLCQDPAVLAAVTDDWSERLEEIVTEALS